jgi:hypothetical protein
MSFMIGDSCLIRYAGPQAEEHVSLNGQDNAGFGCSHTDGRDRSGSARPATVAILVAFANPKSSTLTVPSGLILTSPGFRSRCPTLFRCAASSASAICRAIPSASSKWNRAFLDPIRERRPFDQLHDEARHRGAYKYWSDSTPPGRELRARNAPVPGPGRKWDARAILNQLDDEIHAVRLLL